MRSAGRNGVSVVQKSAESELEAILEIAENAFVIYDAGGGIRLTSERLEPLLQLNQCERDNLLDFASFSEIVERRLPNGQRPFRPPWLLWQPDSEAGLEQLKLADDERVLERMARPVVDESGRVSGWVERYRDLTAEHKLPERLLQTDKLAALGQMLAGVAHDLNNPLTTVMGYGQLLRERSLDPKAMAEVQRICQEAERAVRIVRNLLMMARDAKLERSPVNLNEIVDGTLRLRAYDLQRGGITTEIDLDPDLPSTPANPIQLQQVVLNLVVNSEQAIAEGGQSGHIALRTRHDADRVFLSVEDNGPGVSPELQSRIFEPFFTTKPVGVGTGLGLAIIRGILEQHGGEIEVTSVRGEGTTFSISLPVVPDRAEGVTRQSGDPGKAVTGKRILVAESEPGVGRLIVDALTGVGHRVELVTAAEDVMMRAESAEFDLVICDSKMRRTDGMELGYATENLGKCCGERLLWIGFDPTIGHLPDFADDGNCVCLAKPFCVSELKEVVARLLEK